MMGMRSNRTIESNSDSIPGQEMLGTLPLAGLLLLTLNDHYWKYAFPGFWTGKISDFAGMLFFPFLLTATVSWCLFGIDTLLAKFRPGSRRLRYGLSRPRLTVAVIATGLALAAINIVPECQELYLLALTSLKLGIWSKPGYTMDPSDLSALLLLPFVWVWGARKCIGTK